MVPISKELRQAIENFVNDKGCTSQHLFDISLITLWRLYNGNTETNEPASYATEQKIREILLNNPMPGSIKNYRTHKKFNTISVRFRGEMTYNWVCQLEKLYMFHDGVNDFVRRSICFFLRKEGYINDSKTTYLKEKKLIE